jgi:hypothetical protein
MLVSKYTVNCVYVRVFMRTGKWIEIRDIGKDTESACRCFLDKPLDCFGILPRSLRSSDPRRPNKSRE